MKGIFISGYIPQNFVLSELTFEQEKDADELICLQLHTILDRGEGEKACREMGQRFFEKYKLSQNSSEKSGEILRKICNWIRTNCADGPERKKAIESAWIGIGDAFWTWHAN